MMKLEKDEEALWAQACATFGASVAAVWLEDPSDSTREQIAAASSEWGAMFADGVIEELRGRRAPRSEERQAGPVATTDGDEDDCTGMVAIMRRMRGA